VPRYASPRGTAKITAIPTVHHVIPVTELVGVARCGPMLVSEELECGPALTGIMAVGG